MNNDPLHGKTLKKIIEQLVDFYGFDTLAELININCFKEKKAILLTFETCENIPSPQKTCPKSITYKPPTSSSFSQTSTLFAIPNLCKLQYASTISSVIQVPGWSFLTIFLQLRITSLNAVLKVTLNFF